FSRDWSSDVCSSDLELRAEREIVPMRIPIEAEIVGAGAIVALVHRAAHESEIAGNDLVAELEGADIEIAVAIVVVDAAAAGSAHVVEIEFDVPCLSLERDAVEALRQPQRGGEA